MKCTKRHCCMSENKELKEPNNKNKKELIVEDKGNVAFLQLSIPILVVFRKPDNYTMSQSVSSLIPIVSRTVRDSFKAPYGDVVVLTGPPSPPVVLSEIFTSLALQYGNTPELNKEESNMEVIKFLCENCDVELIYEALGGIINNAKEKIGR